MARHSKASCLRRGRTAPPVTGCLRGNSAQRGPAPQGARGLAPPPAFALQNSALAQVGPGRVAETVEHAGYKLEVLVSPNRAAAPDSFALRITKNGQPVRGASVTLTFNHLQMQMPQQQYQLTETQPGVYSRAAPALIMVGKWGLAFQVAPRSGPPFTALIVDEANG